MKSLHLRSLVYVLTLVTFVGMTAYCQMTTASLTGTVTDQSGAAVPRAQVRVRNVQTGQDRTVTTNEAGLYSVPFLVPGTYDVTIQVEGFQQDEHKGLTVVAAQVARLDSQLTLGKVSDTVAVTASVPLLNPESSHDTYTVQTLEVAELPQSKLDWTDLLMFMPGTTTITRSNPTVLMNGIAPSSFTVTVDGTSASGDAEQPSLSVRDQPNTINVMNHDAIAEVSVVKGIMPASIGGTMSGNVNLISKSGTNNFHGDVFEYNQLSRYNARNAFDDSKNRTTYNQFGGALGGPILKDKLLFFTSYEGVRYTAHANVSGNVPTPYLLSLAPTIYKDALSIYPQASQPASNPTAFTTQVRHSGSSLKNDGVITERADYFLSPASQIIFRYTRGHPLVDTPRVVDINHRQFQVVTDQMNANFVHSGTHYTSSTRWGLNRTQEARIDLGFNVGMERVGFAGLNNGGAEKIQFNGNTLNFIEDFSLVRGRHSLQWGGIVQRLAATRQDYNTAEWSYSTVDDFVSNIPSSLVITFDLPATRVHTFQYGGYLQDNYKMTPTLTFNLGVRYDYFSVPKEADGRIRNNGWDPAFGDGFGPPRPASSLYDADFNNIQPRAGFAWTLGSSHKTVIRGGAGLFVSPHPLAAVTMGQVYPGNGIPLRITLTRPQMLAAGIGYPLPQDQFVPLLQRLVGEGFLSVSLPPPNANSINYPDPYTMQWTFEAERELGWDTALNVSYVGNHSLQLVEEQSKNLPDRLTGVQPVPTLPTFVVVGPWDSSIYEALQVKLDKRFSKGMSFGAYYTRSTNKAYGFGNNSNGYNPPDYNNRESEYGPTNWMIRNAFSGYFVYQLPFMQSAPSVAKAVAGGWQVSGIITANDGMPFSVVGGRSSYPNDHPDFVSGVPVYLDNYQDTRRYLNPAAFVQVPIVKASGAQERLGTVTKNSLWLPGMWNLDFSLAKSFNITEKVHLKVRGDAFNVFNHVNLRGLVTNLASGSFGLLTDEDPRTVQFGARLEF